MAKVIKKYDELLLHQPKNLQTVVGGFWWFGLHPTYQLSARVKNTIMVDRVQKNKWVQHIISNVVLQILFRSYLDLPLNIYLVQNSAFIIKKSNLFMFIIEAEKFLNMQIVIKRLKINNNCIQV